VIDNGNVLGIVFEDDMATAVTPTTWGSLKAIYTGAI
jgi:hypothetical protein